MSANATGDAKTGPLRLRFDRSVKLAFHGSAISSDGGLLLHRELDDALALTDMGASFLGEVRLKNLELPGTPCDVGRKVGGQAAHHVLRILAACMRR